MTSPDDLRIGDRERDEVTGLLHDAFAQGRITREELDERLDAALSARTAGDLRRVTADLPGPDGSGPWRGPHDGRLSGPPDATGAPRGLPWNDDPRWNDDRPWHGAAPWSRQGDLDAVHLGRWGRHVAAARRRAIRRHVRGGRPPIAFFVLAVFALVAVVGHVAAPLFVVGRLLVFMVLISIVLRLARHRHGGRPGPGRYRGPFRDGRRRR